jgi:hypothetical protein
MANLSFLSPTQGNYTGMLTRSIVFSITLFLFLVATGMTIASIIVPNWIAYDTTTKTHKSLHYTYGLHQRCSNTQIPPESNMTPNPPFWTNSALTCTSYPRYSDCQGEDRYFCSMWRSVGFLMSFAVVIEGMTIAAFAILLAGGKQRRESGWGALAILTGLAAGVQMLGMALIVSCHSSSSSAHPFLRWSMMELENSADCAIGLSLRKRRPLLLRLVPRQIVDDVHRLLDF